MSEIITFNHLGARTFDGRFTQRGLIGKIDKIVKSYGYDDGTTKSLVDSFVNDGLLETYNELGFQKWVEFIHGCIKTEAEQRGITNGYGSINV